MNPAKANGTWAGAVSVEQVELGERNNSAVAAWQQGLTHKQVRAVHDYRRSRPGEPLPAAMQRALARASTRR